MEPSHGQGIDLRAPLTGWRLDKHPSCLTGRPTCCQRWLAEPEPYIGYGSLVTLSSGPEQVIVMGLFMETMP
jgi:hypothetical protein